MSAALIRVRGENGVPIYVSRQLRDAGFAHAFSTRHGGVSAAPFDTMNLGVAQAPGECDTEENIKRNAALLLAAAGEPDAVMVRVKQVHGTRVHQPDSSARFGAPSVEADAVISAHAGIAPCIRTADCVPVLIACPKSGAVAAVHAGWRGIRANIVGQVLAAMAQQGGDLRSMVAAIGPCIGCAMYEVGPEVAKEFEDAGLGEFVARQPAWPRPHLDCFGAVKAQLEASGIPDSQIDGSELCTTTAAAPAGEGASAVREFFSYRKDGPRSGRMASLIVPK